MKINTFENNNTIFAEISSQDLVITSITSAVDLMATISFTTDASVIILQKKQIFEEFFDLKTKILGEILQKFVTYKMGLAIIGDFSRYNSESLKDFIYESNKGQDLFFASTKEEVLEKFSRNKA